jgi:hypothetical protein
MGELFREKVILDRINKIDRIFEKSLLCQSFLYPVSLLY